MNRPLLRALTATATLLAGLGSAGATVLDNGSFESGTTVATSSTFCYQALTCGGSVTGWSGNAALIGSNSSGWGTPSVAAGWSPSFGQLLVGLQQERFVQQSVDFTAAGVYQLSWFDAGRGDYGTFGQVYNVFLDGTPVGTSMSVAAGQAWTERSISFTVASAGLHTLRFAGTATNDATAFIDNLSLTASVSAVPEPQAPALALVGLVALAVVARRRKAGA